MHWPTSVIAFVMYECKLSYAHQMHTSLLHVAVNARDTHSVLIVNGR